MNRVMASYSTTVVQMTKMSQRKTTEMSQRKKTALTWFYFNSSQLSVFPPFSALSMGSTWAPTRFQSTNVSYTGAKGVNMFVTGVRCIRTLKSHVESTLSPYFCTTLQLHSLPDNWARELFKAKDAAKNMAKKESLDNISLHPNLFFCYFWTRNARKSITGSKNLDYSLICNKNMSHKSALGVGAQGLMTLPKNAETYPTYDITPKKAKIQNFRIF